MHGGARAGAATGGKVSKPGRPGSDARPGKRVWGPEDVFDDFRSALRQDQLQPVGLVVRWRTCCRHQRRIGSLSQVIQDPLHGVLVEHRRWNLSNTKQKV